jgi:molybdenum cofactor cytidylyltransferase
MPDIAPLRTGTLTAIVLAAGRSTRFGADKLLAHLAGRPVVRHTVGHIAEAGIDDLIVVVPPGRSAEFTTALDGFHVRCVENPDPGRGLASSIRVGLDSLTSGVGAVLLVLGDQPVILPETLRTIIAAHIAANRPITIADYNGVLAPPAIFDSSLVPELLNLEGDQGARAVVDRAPDRVTVVPFASMPPDIDTPDDLDRLQPH